MCGIAGFVGHGNRDDLVRMTDALAHRGPDSEGFYVNEKEALFLGHRRLAIVDIEHGHQPMWNEDHTVCVVFNGEIYNHAELRETLVAKGHSFASHHSDTEVLVHGYEEWGHALPLKLNGMFAFAIVDERRRMLFMARDRFGEKPLYYAQRPGLFAFASELTSLVCHPSIGRSLDEGALQKFFAYGYIPAPRAAIQGTSKLPGGYWLNYDTTIGKAERRCYWRFRLEPDEALSDDAENHLVDELMHLLGQAAQRRLMSDVPLGVFLSGGIDSSTILACLAQQLPVRSLQSFTIGFTERTFDESEPARRVAEYLGTRHHEKTLDVTCARDLIPLVLGRLDEPLGDPSILPTYFLSKFTRQHVAVALSGEGGDEMFAGYDPFAALSTAQLYSRFMPRACHHLARLVAEWLPQSSGNMSLDFKIRRGLTGLSYPEQVWLPTWMSPLEPREIAELFSKPMTLEDIYEEAATLWDSDPKKSIVDKALEFFTQFYLQENILTKVDRAAMLCSLETRAVFLDNDLVEFCRRLPHRFKYRDGQRKYLLKKVALRLLPRATVERKKKGFGIPLAVWLRTVPEQPPLARVAGLNSAYARSAWAEHRSGKRDHRLFLWGWLSLQAFMERLALSTPDSDRTTTNW